MSARKKKSKQRGRACRSAKSEFLASLYQQEFEKTIHLFTEGETEAQYIMDIACDRCVKIIKECQPISSPHVLMQKARDWAFANRGLFFSKDGKKLKDGEKHSIWVLFDDDEKTGEICQTIEELSKIPTGASPSKFKQEQMPKINVGYMKPCIELWGAISVLGTVQGLPKTHGKMESKLAKVMRGYSHKDDARYFDVKQMVQTDKACQMAARWEQTHGAFPDCVDATYFACIHRLVSIILGCKARSCSR